MHLIVFDIDGTLVDSVQADDACFIQAFQSLFGIDLTGADWNQFPQVTDSGLTTSIFQQYMGREARQEEINALKTRFYQLLDQRKDDFSAIAGARAAIRLLKSHPAYAVALATGGWRETAELKLRTVGIPFGGIPFASASDQMDRALICRMAIDQSLTQADIRAFQTISYVGDGLWDLQTSQALGMQFIGVDVEANGKLSRAGAPLVWRDLEEMPQYIANR